MLNMQTQKDEKAKPQDYVSSKDLSENDILRELNSKLRAKIDKLKKEKAEFLAKEVGLIARITELEQSTK